MDPLQSFHLRRQHLFHERPKPEQSSRTQWKMPTTVVLSIRVHQPSSEGTPPLPVGGVVLWGRQTLAGSHLPALLCYWFQLPASAAGARRSGPQSCPRTPRFVSDGGRCARWQQNTPVEATNTLTEGWCRVMLCSEKPTCDLPLPGPPDSSVSSPV